MKVLLLAAGRSTRMSPIEDKNFLNFLGKPLIVHQLDMLKNNGFREVIIVGGRHNVEALKVISEELEMDIKVIEQENLEMGMCGAVLSARSEIFGQSVLVFSSNDVVSEGAFKIMADAVRDDSADGFMIGKEVNSYFPGGYLKVSDLGILEEIIEKPGAGNEPSNLVNLVIHYYSDTAKLFEYLDSASSEKDDLYEAAVDRMIKEGFRIKILPYPGKWQPIKYPWHVRDVFGMLMGEAKGYISDSAVISEKAVIKGDVIIGENVKIFEGAVVSGPCYIGKNTVIANNALVRESHIGDDCVIGFSTEIARSYLGDRVWTHSNYIGDSIIGNNVSFGAGTVTGNLRLDEMEIQVEIKGEKIASGLNKLGLITGDDVRVGINVSTMPGIKIGKNSVVGPGLVLDQNINANSFVKGSSSLIIKENKLDIGEINRSEFNTKLK